LSTIKGLKVKGLKVKCQDLDDLPVNYWLEKFIIEGEVPKCLIVGVANCKQKITNWHADDVRK